MAEKAAGIRAMCSLSLTGVGATLRKAQSDRER
jgi:hypothetical protein